MASSPFSRRIFDKILKMETGFKLPFDKIELTNGEYPFKGNKEDFVTKHYRKM